MTSYEFEVAAKNALLKVLEDDFDILASIEDLQLVWFTHVLGNKKCLIWAPIMCDKYAEVTWAKDSYVMYVDVYEKKKHYGFTPDKLNFEAKK